MDSDIPRLINAPFVFGPSFLGWRTTRADHGQRHQTARKDVMEDDSIAADLSAAMSDTSTQDGGTTSAASVDATAPPEAATIAPAVTTTAATSTDPVRTGPIPFDVHKTALDNARTKAVEEYRQQYGWAEQINRDELLEFARTVQQSKDDPIAYVQNLIAHLQTDAKYGPELRSIAARALQQGRGQSSQAGPYPVIELADGTQVDLNALKTQWTTEIEAKFAPAMSAAAKLEQAERKQEADAFATGFLKDVRTLPSFTTVEPQIKAELAGLIRSGKVGDHPAELENAVRSLYLKHALPKLQTTERSAVLNDITQKAGVNTVSPHAGGAGTPVDYSNMSLGDLFRQEMAARR